MPADTSAAVPFRKFIALVRKSLDGTEQDYTQGGIPRAVVLLAVPMILELSLESVFAVVDMFFVGRLGQHAIATVGLTESVVALVYSLAIGLSTAATAVVARRIGEKDAEAAARAGAQAIGLALGVSVVPTVAGVVFAADILALMGGSAEVVREGAVFTRILFGGSAAIVLLFLINGVFRGAGNAALAMRSLWIASLLNIVLCPVLIHFYGLKGAAIATVAGRSAGVAYQCWHLFRGGGLLRFAARHFAPHAGLVRTLASIAWPATFQFVIASGSWIVLSRLVADAGGTTASAGYQIAIRNVVFFILPAWGLSNAAATLVGQNLGAGHVRRAEQSVWLAARYNAAFMGLVTVLFVFFAGPIIGVFSTDAAVVAYGAEALRIIGAGYVFYGIGMVMTQALNGAGDTRTPTVINFVCFWLLQIPLAYVLAKMLGLGATGVFIAIPVAETAIALLAWHAFRRGRWQRVRV